MIGVQPAPSAEPAGGAKWQRYPWRTLAPTLLGTVLVAVAIAVAGMLLRKDEVRDPVRPKTIEPFSLKDARGRTHELVDWRDARAVVLFVIGTECPVTT